MKNLITAFYFLFTTVLVFSQASWQQVGDLSTIYASTASPILKNLSDGRPVLICTNEADELTIALFDIQSNSWVFKTYGFLSGIFNLSADVFDQTIIIGCKSTNGDYGVYLYDVPTDNLTDLTAFSGTYNNTVEGTIKVTCGGLSPLKVALAYEFSDGVVGSVEYNSGNGSWEPLAENSSDIFPNNTAVIYGSAYGIKTVSNTNTIYIVSNFNGGAGNSLRVFSKEWGSVDSFVEALDGQSTATAIEMNGAQFFDVSSNKGANANVIHNFAKNLNELMGRIQSNPGSVIQTPYGPYTHAGNIFELANTGNNSTNYVFHSDDYNPVGSFVRSWNGTAWNQIGGPVVTGTIYELDMMMHPLTKKPFVSFGDGNGNYTVKAFNTAPVFLQEGTPAVFCSNNVSNMLLDSLIFSDADGDSLVFNGISSSNTNVVDPGSVTVASIGYNPVTGINGFEITGQPGNLGTTTLTISFTDGIETVSHSFDVTIHEAPDISAGPDVSVCFFEGVTLNASGTGGTGTYSYSWSTGTANGDEYFPQNYPDDTVTVTGVDGNGCYDSDTLVIDLLAPPNVWAPQGYPSGCEGDAYVLEATGNAIQYIWNNGVTDGDVVTPPAGTTMYIVTGIGSNGCTANDTTILTVYPNPIVDAGPDFEICAGQGVTLYGTATGGTGTLTTSWSNGVIDGVEFFPQSSGTFAYSAEDENGCGSLDFTAILVNPNPTVIASYDGVNEATDTTLCENSIIVVEGIGAGILGSYTWDNPISNGSPSIISTSGYYTVTGTDNNGCSGTDSLLITVLNGPITNAPGDYNVCENTPINLTATGDATTYTWDNGVVDGQTFTPNVGITSYQVTGTGSNGCVSTDDVNVTVYPAPVVDGGPDVTVCASEGITLTATASGGTGNLDISWDNCLNGVEFFPLISGVYTAFVTDDQGCNGEDPVLVTVLNLPTIDAGNDITICEGDSITLNATGASGGFYNWDSPIIQGEQVIVETSGYYTVIGTDNNGCSNSDSLLVTLNSNPVLNVPADISVCEDDGVTLTATGAGAGANYVWSNNVINGQEFFPPVGLNEITVIGTNVNGCQGYDTVGVNVHMNWFTTENATICKGDTLNWNGQLLDSTGSYTQVLTSVYGCDSTATLNLNVIEPIISAPFDEVCQNQNPITLMNFVTPIGGNFSGTGVFNNKFYPNQVAPNNVYTITYTRYFAAYGCSASTTFDLTVNPTPAINMNVTDANCGQEDGSATASFSSLGSNGLHDAYWSVGFMDSAVVSSSISNLSPGLYFVNVNNEYGCTATAPATISSNTISISGTSSPVSCFGGNDGSIDISITNSAGIASIHWSNGATSEDLVNLTAGPYEVTVIDNNGCESIASFNVTGPAEMTWTTSTMNSSCGNADGSASVVAQGGTGSFDWEWYDSQNNLLSSSTGMQANLLAGEYTCVMTDQSGCITTVSVVVSDEGSPEIELVDVVNASCANDGSIDIDINSNNGVQSISWSNGDSTEDISGLAPDEYTVYVMDTLGCAGMLWVNVEPVLPETQPICLITVDTITTTNKLIWERAQLTGIASYNIYRETSESNVYQLVHSQLFDEVSEWTDTVASPMVRSWRYKMTAVDSCGNESDFSPVHKTIHLTISAGIGDDVNLHWDSYEGFQYTQFKLWRVTDATGWIELTTMPSNLFSYTDLSIINEPGLDYLIEIEPADPCTSEKAQDYNSSRSNKARGEFNPNNNNAGIPSTNISNIELYPNPVSNELTIKMNGQTTNTIEAIVLDAVGNTIEKIQLSNEITKFNTQSLERGIYIIKLEGSKEVLRFVKN